MQKDAHGIRLGEKKAEKGHNDIFSREEIGAWEKGLKGHYEGLGGETRILLFSLLLSWLSVCTGAYYRFSYKKVAPEAALHRSLRQRLRPDPVPSGEPPPWQFWVTRVPAQDL